MSKGEIHAGPHVSDIKRPLSAIFAGLVLCAIFVGGLVLFVLVYGEQPAPAERDLEWWQRSIVYHVYVPSYYDSDGDGYGDLKGVEMKLDHIQSLGVDSIWFSPFYEHEGVDIGNDVLNHTRVDKIFGTDQDMEDLFAEIKRRGMHVILDLIPNHVSVKSELFQRSVNDSRGPYSDAFIWAPSLGWDADGNPTPPNNWRCATGESAWTWNEVRKEFYFHNFLPNMPDLNLYNGKVQQMIKDTMEYWLAKEPVLGFHIGGFNILIEENYKGSDSDKIVTNVTASIDFLKEIHNISSQFTEKDGLQRLFLLEFFSGQYVKGEEVYWQAWTRNSTKGVAELPFSFGDLPWKVTSNLQELNGDSLEQHIREYIEDGPKGVEWPCWELNDHDAISSQGDFDFGRIPKDYMDAVVVMALMLPGTSIIYYGDEIGMANTTNISYDDTVDPYAQYPYADETNYTSVSRDPYRTPMQWDNTTNAGFTNTTKPWLPIANDYLTVNVQTEASNLQEASQLHLFHHLTSLRHHKALHSGSVYFPYSDTNIFSFLRKDESDTTAFLVVINIGKVLGYPQTVNFRSVSPMIPKKGHVIITSTLHNPSFIKLGEINLNNVTLYPKESVVIMISYEEN